MRPILGLGNVVDSLIAFYGIRPVRTIVCSVDYPARGVRRPYQRSREIVRISKVVSPLACRLTALRNPPQSIICGEFCHGICIRHLWQMSNTICRARILAVQLNVCTRNKTRLDRNHNGWNLPAIPALI